jgi:hypothetical protein
MRSLGVWFVTLPAVQIPIKNGMKTLTAGKNKKAGATLFQVAAKREDSPAVKPATSLDETPLADLMLHPEKVATVLETPKVGDSSTGQAPAQRAMRNAMPKKPAGGVGKPSRRSPVKTEFHFKAPLAGSVKLAADFTDWEKSPLDMSKSQDGVWQLVVPLPPGDHAYRFIVDGEWRDDPHPALCVPNPFGSSNAVVKVTGGRA